MPTNNNHTQSYRRTGQKQGQKQRKKQGPNNKNKNQNNNSNNYQNKKNIYEVCGIVERFIGNTCHKHNIDPSVLYEELHYQLPAEWVEGLRYIIRNSARIQVKREFDISSSESATSSEI